MKKTLRILLFVFALVIGGFLGWYLLSGYELTKMLIFVIACILLGYVFHEVDKKLNE